MEIITADHAGFCFGVRRAIELTEEQIRLNNERPDDKKISLYTCGQLIHNRAVTERLRENGVGEIQSIDQAGPGDTIIIRSHGEPEEFYKKAEAIGVNLVDTTCVFVGRIHQLVHQAAEEGRKVIIVGSRDHQEVIATNGWCQWKGVIIQDVEEAEKWAENFEQGQDDGLPLIVCQTTIRRELLDDILRVLDRYEIRYELKNTICNATRERQDACARLAAEVDMMVVIGDPNSSNSKKLYEIAKKYCKHAVFVRDISDLELKEVHKYNRIGITAGASTPAWIIKEVISSMSQNVITDEKNPMFDYMDQIEDSLRLPKPGEIVEGEVIDVLDNEVIINMGCKKDGILRKDEVTLEEGQKLSDVFKVGDTVEAKVMKSDEGDGGISLSKKKLEMNENYKELKEFMENKESINVEFIRAVNGGVIAQYKQVTGFIPMSQLSDRYVEKADEFIGQRADVKVIRVDDRRNRAVFSRKAVLVEEKRKQVEEIWANLNVGDIVEGKVMRFTDYGAFVDIGGVDGLLHISEISWGKLKHPQEVLSIGDIINVKILALNEEKGKISLGLKQTQPEPWSLVGTKYVVGQVIEGKVVQIKEYGAFVELEAGLDGLVHISEIANKRVDSVSDELQVGQVIKAKIMDIDTDRHRISLSIKATLSDDEDDAEEETAEEN
ncbi:bifunctional 4-hydroxy-3-methylbut-2-enyl diphosphate reductase/30S ribosomal protein S1 [Mobilibacterium timonense]|uniref:bifunctional 4-hydroxy-3-methylbut-2-enyl diphosphate reductase/30S ribosomal protein S1 n=3 Tax=Mobilibacterium timonense TaxID=1871012 RepID=UPI00098414A8|nr:bifunctional 4-hydroxy-3-methylbut-2-enyl diphosphate reductase/30S ribosomal protein S1 [Mobilibacterium timonense]